MDLPRLKKRLKQQTRAQIARKRKTNPALRWLVVLVFLGLIGGGAYVFYQQQHPGPAQLLEQAIEAESLGRFESAQQLYQRIGHNYPLTAAGGEALLRLGRLLHYDRNQPRRALAIYLRLERDYPATQQALQAREEAARIAKGVLRDYSQAIADYQRLLTDHPEAGDRYLFAMADCYFRLENYSQARIELERLLQEYPHSQLGAAALDRQAGMLLLEKRIEDARQHWQRVVESYPASSYRPRAEFNLAKILENEERLQEALQQYKAIKDFAYPALLQEKIERLQQRIAAKKKTI
jgi:TolA-binding protein